MICLVLLTFFLPYISRDDSKFDIIEGFVVEVTFVSKNIDITWTICKLEGKMSQGNISRVNKRKRTDTVLRMTS